jgi:hypothetical protein
MRRRSGALAALGNPQVRAGVGWVNGIGDPLPGRAMCVLSGPSAGHARVRVFTATTGERFYYLDGKLLQPPPVRFGHWRGGLGTVRRPVGDWPWPASTQRHARDWLELGWAPRPRSVAEGFRYHLGHGLVMGYPLLSVLAFAWRNRGNFSSRRPAA